MISLLPIQVIEAADTKPVELAPIPTQIATAKKVFIATPVAMTLESTKRFSTETSIAPITYFMPR
jgi:hypothetical protein